MAIHSRTIAWKIPWTEEPGRLQAMGSQRVGHDWATSPTSKIQLECLNRLYMWLFSQTILWRKSKSSLHCSHSVKDSEKINFWQSYFGFKLLLEFWNLFVFLLLFVWDKNGITITLYIFIGIFYTCTDLLKINLTYILLSMRYINFNRLWLLFPDMKKLSLNS